MFFSVYVVKCDHHIIAERVSLPSYVADFQGIGAILPFLIGAVVENISILLKYN